MQSLSDARPGCSAPVSRSRNFSGARCIRHAVLVAALAGSVVGWNPAQAAPAIPAVQLGYGIDPNHDIQKVEAAFLWDSGYSWGNPQGLLLDLLWEVNVASWHGTSNNNPRNPWEFGFSPVARVAWKRHTWVPFLELSLGVRLLTETRTSDDHAYATAFQFSEIAGVGVAFGNAQQFAVGYRFQHISNAGIKQPNPGTSFSTIYLRYRF